MSFKFLSIEYVGNQSQLKAFLESKVLNIEIQNIGHTKLVIKIPEGLVEEIKFFKNFSVDDSLENPTIIISIEDSTEGEFNLAALTNNKSVSDNSSPNGTTTKSIALEITPEDIKENIASALLDTILPSKSPLQHDDPFRYLTSQNFLSNFLVCATILTLVMNLIG